ncbi:MAG: sigma 54-interacting transcriptional regulator [Proteobacteria bacterium]|nr:sigma 54-interacting transcriptional regulator [Pseudomonadota bacterium]
MGSKFADLTTIEHAALPLGSGRASPKRRATLVFYCPQGVRLVELVENTPVVVGRKLPADVLIDDLGLSRQHARFVWKNGDFVLEDLGSRNGCKVAQTRIDSARVQPGDSIQLGGVAVALHVTSERSEPRTDAAVVVHSAKMRELYTVVGRVAKTTAPVLILGETGSGKELVAQAIHAGSARAKAPFSALNCAAIPATLLEATLFGHERGSFTGADRMSKGLFEQADAGTVFLDEVGELSAAAQAALLRVIETRSVQRIGSSREIELDVRVLAATHRDLEAMVCARKFRADLLYRLNAFTLRVPPLRERPDEVILLAELFLQEASREWKRPVDGIDADASERLVSYPWPGNVRELRNAVERAVIVCSGGRIRKQDLPESVRTHAEPPAGSKLEAAAKRALSGEGPGLDSDDLVFKERVQQYEIKLILRGLERAGGNQTRAAELLRIPLRTLVHKLRAYGIKKSSASD